MLLAGCARHYRAQGIVLAVDRTQRSVTISHRAIPGYMEAMSMPFRAGSEQELQQLRPGSRVEFQLRVSREHTTIHHIRLRQPQLDDVPLPKAEGKVSIGAPVPDFSLIDQAARDVRLSDFRGRLVAVDFIYTRCPLPDVCPRLSANFARLQKRFGDQIVLLSITLDPEHDSPGVLLEYAQRWGADARKWMFLTGPPDAVRKTAGFFGVVYWPEEGAITHTSSTAIVDRRGRLAALVEGSSFTSRQLIDLVETVATTSE